MTHARTCNGSGAKITFNGSVFGVFGYGTVAALVKKSADGVWDAVSQMTDGLLTPVWGFEIADTNKLLLSIDNSNFADPVSMSLTVAEGWCVIAATKASGISQPVIFYKVPIGGSLSSESVGSFPNSANGVATMEVGEFIDHTFTGDYFFGEMAIHAAWKNVVLTSTQIASLATHYNNWLGNAGGVPTWQVSFKQISTATTIPDDTGGTGGQTAISGNTVSTAGPALPGYGV